MTASQRGLNVQLMGNLAVTSVRGRGSYWSQLEVKSQPNAVEILIMMGLANDKRKQSSRRKGKNNQDWCRLHDGKWVFVEELSYVHI